MSPEKKYNKAEDFLNYLGGSLSGEERHRLERALERDPFAKEAMEGLESVGADAARDDLLSLHLRLRKRLRRRRRIALYGIAATAASLLIVGSLFLKLYEFAPGEKEDTYLLEEPAPPPERAGEMKSAKPLEDMPAESAEMPEEENEFPPVSQDMKQAEPDLQAIEDISPKAELVAPPVDQQALTPDREEITVLEAEPSGEGAEEPARAAEKSRSRKRRPAAMLSAKSIPTGKVSGVVISHDNKDPIPGATIIARGAEMETISNSEGRFYLPVEENSKTTLIASFIGMEPEEVEVEGSAEVEFLMKPDLATINEPVIIGNQAEAKSPAAGNVQQPGDHSGPSQATYRPAEPAGGIAEFKSFVEKNIQLPEDLESGQKKIVVIRFTVSEDGSVRDVEALRSPGVKYTDEAIRLLGQGPSWNPATRTGHPVDQQVRIRILFQRKGN